eukprot:TRINITY_DN14939_c0_g1_i8.p1 TRINITY_DN14939_c0_g1~~TRINITY_DN14939_c0_g1_i8.p1  ORF type:complete len:201 (+),score=20.18 TRINITY_DN14939_c0_g1_i8:113-715(+)
MGKWSSEHLNTTYCISLKEKQEKYSLVAKSPMLRARAWHGTSTLLDLYIYAVGGYNTSEATLCYCERYSVAGDRWQAIPSLIKGRWGLSVTLFNARVLYCFFGMKERRPLTDIEAFDCLDEEQGWRQVYSSQDRPKLTRRCHATMQVSNTAVLIFGGDPGGTSADQSLCYDTEKRSVECSRNGGGPVSYTHLTLPTICSV